MAPWIEVSEKTLKGLEQLGISYTLRENKSCFSVLNVAKQKTLQNKTWFEVQRELQRQGLSMLTIPEFIEWVKSNPDIYKEITEVRSPWRAEWLDGYFEQGRDGLYILTGNKTKTEKLDDNTLMEDKQIGLDSWLENPTSQGLPRRDVKQGDLYYWHPRADSVAGFYAYSDRADLSCLRDPRNRDSNLGVHAVRRE